MRSALLTFVRPVAHVCGLNNRCTRAIVALNMQNTCPLKKHFSLVSRDRQAKQALLECFDMERTRVTSKLQ
ncbi:hypothetical protein PUN4_230003 [Paraburkholderia unamae]|nr:hypothetical protein PUN4_230003 [Paraburkholderia unamae]